MKLSRAHRHVAARSVTAGVLLLCIVWLAVDDQPINTAHAMPASIDEPAVSAATSSDTDEDNGGDDREFPFPIGELWGFAAAGVLAVLYAVTPGFIGKFISHMFSGLVKLSEWRRRPLLRPSPFVTATEIDQMSRIPLEPTVSRRGRVGMWRRIVIASLWPSSPKPAFVLRTWHMVDSSMLSSSNDEFRVGGFRLHLRLPVTEDRDHLAFSLRCSTLRSTMVLLICTPDDYVSSFGRVHCIHINGKRTKLDSLRPDTLIVYSADALRLDGSNYRVFPRSGVPYKGTWLFSLDRHGGRHPRDYELDTRVVPVPHEAVPADFRSQLRYSFKKNARQVRQFRDPAVYDILRWRHFVQFLLLLPISVLLALHFATSKLDKLSDTVFYAFGWTAFISIIVLGSYVAVRLPRYLYREWRVSSLWEGSTTRCLADGARIRDGLYSHLTPANRARVRIIPTSPELDPRVDPLEDNPPDEHPDPPDEHPDPPDEHADTA